MEAASSGLSVEALRDGRLSVSGTAQRRYGITIKADGFAPQRISLAVAAEPRELDVALAPLPAAVPEIIVTASRYELVRDAVTAPLYLDQRAIEQQPDFGDDPLRALHRLPGAAAGVSAKAHLRGAELNETAVVLNGQRLLDPFHIRDYQSMFSAIDARAIDGMQVYTGGFPVRYGDSMGALVLVDALEPHEPRHSELGLSVLNTSALSAGTIGDGTGNWLVSGRRSNLEHVVNERLGEPSYYDFFGELGVNFSERTQVSVNVLSARDEVLLVTEADPTEHEQSQNDTRNSTFWVHWQQQWSNGLESSTTFSSSAFDSTRHAQTNDPETIIATVTDRRDVSIAGVRQDWQLGLGDRHALSFGAEYQRQRADYDYSAAADYFGFFLTFPGITPTLRRSAAALSERRLHWCLRRGPLGSHGRHDGRARAALRPIPLHRHAGRAAREPARQRAARAQRAYRASLVAWPLLPTARACTSCRSRTASRRSIPRSAPTKPSSASSIGLASAI